MANPVFNNSPIFQDPSARKVNATTTTAPASTIDAVTLEKLYGAPSATTRETGRMTYDDVIVRTGGLLALLVVVAAAAWSVTDQFPWLYWVGAIAGLVLGLVNAFRSEPSPALIVAYTVAEGVFVGSVSFFFSRFAVADSVDGTAQPIVMQAVIATMVTFAAALLLFRSGKVRVTAKFTKWLLVAMVGYLAFSLLNVILWIFMPANDGFGPLRNGVWGLLAGLFAVGLAAACLIMDFDSIKRGVDKGVPAKFAWSAAFGLIVTLVWLYLEFLRIFAMLSRN